MKKINLFNQFNVETLFTKAKKQIQDQVAQWPVSYFEPSEMERNKQALKNAVFVDLPEIDFAKGEEVITEKIYPLAEMQPGIKTESKVKVQVLQFKFSVDGHLLLLGCQPAGHTAEPPGEWYADTENGEICLEYKWYSRSPRKTFTAHKQYIEDVIRSYDELKSEFGKLGNDIEAYIHDIAAKRKNDWNKHLRLLAGMIHASGQEVQGRHL